MTLNDAGPPRESTPSEAGRLGGNWGRALVAILAAAAATAWLQLVLLGFRRHVLGVFSWKWWLRDQFFLSAAGYLILIGALTLLPLLIHLLWPRRYTFAAFAGSLAGLGVFCALLVFERVSWLAWLVFAVGVGLQVGQRVRARPEEGWRWTRRIAVFGNLATILVVLGFGWARGSAEARALAALSPPPPGAPNVLLVVLDTERAGSLSLHGARVPTTPALERRARQGVVFDEAYATAPWTLPSHATMFTGRYPSETSADWLSPLDRAHPTLAEVFGDAGYATGGFVANVIYGGYHTGLARGFQHYQDTRRSLREILFGTTLGQSGSATRALLIWERTRWISGSLRALWPLELSQPYALLAHDRKPANVVVDGFLRWLTEGTERRPFLAFLNLFDAHAPYLPPERYRTMFDSTGSNLGRYLGATRYLDDMLEALLAELGQWGQLSNTVVAVTSDHGELFGEHQEFGHGNELFRPLLHVPLVVLNAPGAVPATRVRHAVSLRDLAATLADLADLQGAPRLGGTSLRPLLSGDTAWRGASPAVSEISQNSRPDQKSRTVPSALRSLVNDTLHVIQAEDGRLRAFAFPTDTAELVNLADSPVRQESAAEWLDSVLTDLGLPWPDRPRQ